jgi:hemin uptake protein HemP
MLNSWDSIITDIFHKRIFQKFLAPDIALVFPIDYQLVGKTAGTAKPTQALPEALESTAGGQPHKLRHDIMSAAKNPESPISNEHSMADRDDLMPADSTQEDAQRSSTVARVIRSEDLFAGRRTVVIQHANEQYRLLITRNDRLILQK